MDVNNLIDKAKELVENVPDDIKEKATGFVEEAGNQMPEDVKEKASGFLSNLRDKFGL